MSEFPKLKIRLKDKTKAPLTTNVEVLLDGVDVTNCLTGLQFSMEPGGFVRCDMQVLVSPDIDCSVFFQKEITQTNSLEGEQC